MFERHKGTRIFAVDDDVGSPLVLDEGIPEGSGTQMDLIVREFIYSHGKGPIEGIDLNSLEKAYGKTKYGGI